MKGGGDKLGRSRSSPPPLRLDSQLFRRVSVVVGCFLFVLVFLLSSRHDAAVFDTLSLKTTSLREPAAAETLRSSAGHEARNATAAAVGTNSDDRAAPGTAAEPVRDDAVHVTAAAAIAAQPTTFPRHGLPGDTGSDSVDRQRLPPCDFSASRADLCDFAGDIRMDASAATFVVVVDPAVGGATRTTTTTTHKVRPYPRKGDATAMGRVTEITVRTTTTAEAAPRCTRTHAAPAVVFSVGGYAGNIFHDFTDVIVPLYYSTARRYYYRGDDDVQLVVTDADPRWLAKYGALLRGLSRHPHIDLAKAGAAGEVHCFRHAVVTLRAHRELLIERGATAAGPTMPDFSRFLRRALSLPRDETTTTRPAGDDGSRNNKPRLLIISRRGTRKLLNIDAVCRAAEEVGFEAVVSELDLSDDVARVGRMINSYDALVGVHGAGLTNMVFLPPGAAVVQIVPWGGLRWIARLDFGDPAEALGFRYIQYEVAVEESTLKDKYPRDHEVFTNPTALHNKGFTFLRRTFLNGQDIIVNVDRFRPVLLQVLRNLRQ